MDNIDTLLLILQHLNICDIGNMECVAKKYKQFISKLNWVNFKSFITYDNAKYLTLNLCLCLWLIFTLGMSV
jgi:hypothetical protein